MAPVHVDAPGGAWPPVHILVVTEESEIDAPLVEAVGDDPNGMAAIEADGNAPHISLSGESLHVQELAAPVVDAGQEDEGDLLRHRIDYVVLLDGPPVPALHENKVLSGVAPSQLDLGGEGVEVAGEVQLVGQDLPPRPLGLVESGHQSVEVHRRAAADHHLPGLRPHHPRLHLPQPLGVGDPGYPAPSPSPDPEGLPLLDDLKEASLGVLRNEPQGVSVHVDLPREMVEPVLVGGEGILGVQSERVIHS